jgi:hypothetical protein
MRLALAWMVTVALIFAAVAGTISPEQSDQIHIEYGKKFKSVARLSCRNVTTNQIQQASCVIISPTWVITAAHVVEGTDDWVVTADDGTSLPLRNISIHKDFKGGYGKNDVAVGRVDGEFNLDFYPTLYDGDDEIGKVVSIAGYGLYGTWDTGAVESDGKKRAGSNIVDCAYGDVLVCSVDGGKSTELEFLIGSGDSGGGLFIGSQLAGINSFVMVAGRKPKSKRGEESGHTRISCCKSWIEQEMSCHDE